MKYKYKWKQDVLWILDGKIYSGLEWDGIEVAMNRRSSKKRIGRKNTFIKTTNNAISKLYTKSGVPSTRRATRGKNVNLLTHLNESKMQDDFWFVK